MQDFQPIQCEHDGHVLNGVIAVPEGPGPHPAVLVMHHAIGLGKAVHEAMKRLTALGYVAVGADMYGPGRELSEEEVREHIVPLHTNPSVLRARVVRWFDLTVARADVDPARTAAIGYCFGGQCVLELARSGADVKAVVSFHGLLGTHAPAHAGTVHGQVAVYTGAKDPWAPAEDVEALRNELTEAEARHQITVFSDAEHAFTDPDGHEIGRAGIRYHPIADKVSWAGTVALLGAVLRG